MSELALRPAHVPGKLLLARGGQVHERSGELAVGGVRRGIRSPAEMRDGFHVLALSQMRLAIVERSLIERGLRRPGPLRTAYALSHRNPTGAAGGLSGLRGRSLTGAGALYPPGATSLAESG